jgi:sugar lactone lactonase YvrE
VGISSKDSGKTKPLAQFWSEDELKNGKKEKMRANDGAVDSKGRFWVSAVCDPEVTPFAPEGKNIYAFET